MNPGIERRASLSSAKREVERIGTRIKKLLNLMLDDEIAVGEGKAEIKALDARRKELQARLENADEPPSREDTGPRATAPKES